MCVCVCARVYVCVWFYWYNFIDIFFFLAVFYTNVIFVYV